MTSETAPIEPTITTAYHNGVATVTMPSDMDLDVQRSPELRTQIMDAMGNPETTSLVIDISNVTRIDSTGLGVLVGALKQTRKREMPMVVDYSNQEKLQKVFRVMSLVDVMRLVGTREEYDKSHAGK